MHTALYRNRTECQNAEDFLPKHRNGCIDALRELGICCISMKWIMSNKNTIDWMLFSLRIGRCTLSVGLYAPAPKEAGSVLCWLHLFEILQTAEQSLICFGKILQTARKCKSGKAWYVWVAVAPTASSAADQWLNLLQTFDLFCFPVASHCFQLIVQFRFCFYLWLSRPENSPIIKTVGLLNVNAGCYFCLVNNVWPNTWTNKGGLQILLCKFCP